MKKITLFIRFVIISVFFVTGIQDAMSQIVVSQIYGGGGNSGATYKNDFIELYNRGTSAVSIKGWSLQYASATGTTWGISNKTKLPDVSIQPGKYYLVQEAAGTGGSTDLPTPDFTGTLALSGTAGKVALCSDTTSITSANFTQANPNKSSIIVDFVGFGTTANQYEGTGPTTSPSNTTAVFRANNGNTDTDDNKNDFTAGAPSPRNSSYSANTTAVPTFSLAAGNYTTTQSVTLSSTTPNAKIYYTIDGSAPDNTKTLYQSAISVSSTMTIKAIAYDANNSNPSLSVAVASYVFPTSVANIGVLRANTTGFYTLTGEAVVTLKSATRNAKYIQDATGGVVIDDPNSKITSSYNVGDGMKNLTGTLSLYSGMLQFTPYQDPGVAASSNNNIVSKVVTLSELGNHQSEIVTVNNIQINDLATGGNGTFISLNNYPIAGTSTEVIRTAYADLDYVGTTLPSASVNITGVVMTYVSGNTTLQQLIPRSRADIIATGLFSPKVQNLNVWNDNNKVVFDATFGEKVEIYNAVGQKILSQPAIEGKNELTVNNKGVTIVKVGDRVGKVIL